ncbi:MAG: glycosyltransferase family 2 protein, partial [Firmicutes bacterium HGW-Firmicutes-13]
MSLPNNHYPLVTVLMSVYNGEKYLNKAIESILDQTFADYEFLIIDDGSTDNSLEIINLHHDPRIRLIINPENYGLTKTLNIGICLAQGYLIARADADDFFEPTRLEKQIDFLQKHQDVDVVGTW